MPALESDGSLTIAAGDVIQVSVQAAVTAAKTLTVIAIYGDY